MKIQLPDGRKVILDESLSLSEKIETVTRMTDEWQPLLSDNWDSFSVKVFLDSLSNYLVWHKIAKRGDRFNLSKKKNTYIRFKLAKMEKGLTERGKEDKHILSRKKMEKLVRYKKTSKAINFSDLNDSQSEILFGERGMTQ
jgi:hypothetical protein